MNVLMTGKNMVLNDALERYATEKFHRLTHFRPDLESAEVELTRQATRDVQNHYVSQANLIAEGRLIARAEERAGDPYVAIDALVDLLERQLQRQHERIGSERRPTAHGHLPPAPPEAFREPSTLEIVLSDFGIDAATIAHLEERGIHTIEQLRALVDDDRLSAWLGPGWERQTRDLIQVIEKLRLHE
jgi:ribosomal subunit interface protein